MHFGEGKKKALLPVKGRSESEVYPEVSLRNRELGYSGEILEGKVVGGKKGNFWWLGKDVGFVSTPILVECDDWRKKEFLTGFHIYHLFYLGFALFCVSFN